MQEVAILEGTRIAVLATHGFEQSELEIPLERLRSLAAEVEVVSLDESPIRGWREDEWGRSVTVDRLLESTSPERYAALVLPGGVLNADRLRGKPEVIAFVQAFATRNKPIAAICHAPWLLGDAQLLRGCEVTSHPSIRSDLVHAGGRFLDQSVVVDGSIITSRGPADLEVFCDALILRLSGKTVLAAE